MYFGVAAILTVLSVVVALLLDYFGNRKKAAWYVQITAFVAWVFPFFIMFILPLDMASSWIRSGEFSPGRKLYYALKENLIYYGVLGVVGLVFLIYALAWVKIAKEDLLAIAMAAANAWGLLLITVMLGYGLVEIPRGLWYTANAQWCFRYLEFQAPQVKEAVVDAEADLYEVAREIALAAKKVDFDDPLRPFVDKLMEKCPLALEERNLHDDDDIPPTVTGDYLRSLHARIVRAVKVSERTQAQYQFLLQKAYLYQDIISNYQNVERKFKSITLNVPEDRFKKYKLAAYWWWYVWIRPMGMRGLSIILLVASLAVVWSESTFQVESVTLSVPRLLLQSPYISYATLEIVSMSFIVYMCTCAYSTLFNIKVFDIYQMVPEHHTDEGSLLFVGNYLCKLTFPLCYNFLNMLSDEENSVFVQYQGRAASLTPLLGEGYNKWLPVMILVFSIITALNLHGKLLRLFKLKSYFYENISPHGEDIEEGRNIIDQARGVEERRLRGGPSTGGYTGLGAVASRGVAGGRTSGSRGMNAKDLLAKYKSRNRDSAEPLNRVGSSVAGEEAGATGGLAGKKSSPFKASNLLGVFGGGGSGADKATGGGAAGGGAGKFEMLRDEQYEGLVSGSPPSSRSSRKFGLGFGGATGGTAPTTGSGGQGGGGFALGGLGSAVGNKSKSAPSPGPSQAGGSAGGRTAARPPPRDIFGDI
ncbi:LMBR1 domain-containing protein 2 [Borealophlyctis nickersoniae]|nr:LMBR1 domain-containing protein 2 [Borealophlyctis nickersoniae]